MRSHYRDNDEKAVNEFSTYQKTYSRALLELLGPVEKLQQSCRRPEVGLQRMWKSYGKAVRTCGGGVEDLWRTCGGTMEDLDCSFVMTCGEA
ncbi:uncharacterized [Tachysurus ichikawai]